MLVEGNRGFHSREAGETSERVNEAIRFFKIDVYLSQDFAFGAQPVIQISAGLLSAREIFLVRATRDVFVRTKQAISDLVPVQTFPGRKNSWVR